ncbi:MAG TPA: ABC transporter permease, partial [Blastocatellia bacterium]|nr:ABC transporter permease [Blastocatellia bacterium]
MNSLLQDLRYSLRLLAKKPGFTLIAVMTLALGIGANTAMFSVLNTYLFRALPYPGPERLVRVYRTSPHSQSWPHSPGNFFDFREQNDVFEFMAAFNSTSINVAEPGEPAERLEGMTATADFFDVLGVRPALGRVFTPEEEVTGSNRVVVLSHRFWMRRFGGDPGVIDRTLQLAGRDAKVIGVMPPGVEYPLLWGNVDLWAPQAFTPEQRRDRGTNYLQAVARLKPGVSIEQAEQAMRTLAANLAKDHPDNSTESLRLEPLQLSMSDEIGRKVMWFTFALAGLVLLIACANLANLQLVRTAARTREYAIRAALGAGRARLLRQSLTESLLISLLGGAVSIVLAQWAITFISRRLFSDLPGVSVALDMRVFGFALLISLLTGLIFGTVPAWLASRADVNQAVRENARGSTAGRSQHHLRHALIVGEVAFALVLLAGAGLFLRGLQRFIHTAPGWQVDGLLTAQVALQGPKYAKDPPRAVFYQQLEERLRALPGVEQVGISASQPVWGFNSSGGVIIEGQPEPPPGQYPEIFFEPVSPQYFDTLGVRLLEGRAFTAADTADVPERWIINESMARQFWPNESAIGKRIGRPGPNPRWREVIGVVNDVGFPGSLGEPYTRYQSFRPLPTSPPWGGTTITLRTSVSPEALTQALRDAVADVDPAQPVYEIRTAQDLVREGLGNLSLLGALLGAFAALGFVLAALGIY